MPAQPPPVWPAEQHGLAAFVPLGVVEEGAVVDGDHDGAAGALGHRVVRPVVDVGRLTVEQPSEGELLPGQAQGPGGGATPSTRSGRRRAGGVGPAPGVGAPGQQGEFDIGSLRQGRRQLDGVAAAPAGSRHRGDIQGEREGRAHNDCHNSTWRSALAAHVGGHEAVPAATSASRRSSSVATSKRPLAMASCRAGRRRRPVALHGRRGC